MSECRIHRKRNKTENFTIVSNELFQRVDISMKAKGLYAYLMTLPEDWKIYKKEVYKHFPEGRTAIDGAFKELIEAGYIRQEQLKDETNRFSGWDYTVYESVEGIVTASAEKPQSENLQSENLHLLKTNNNQVLNQINTTADEKPASSLNWKDVETFFIDEEGWASMEYGRQRKACKVFVSLIEEEFKESSQEALTGVLSTFRRLHRGKDTFWSKMPYKPSTAISEKVAPLLFKAYRDERKTQNVSIDFDKPDWMQELDSVRPRTNRAYDLFKEGED